MLTYNVKNNFLYPSWSLPLGINALITTRNGGVSNYPFGCIKNGMHINGGLNLSFNVGDNPIHVKANRSIIENFIRVPIVWLNQIHGISIINAEIGINKLQKIDIIADASITNKSGVACAVMTADCMPILLCDKLGHSIGAIHAGWKGIAQGIIEKSIKYITKLANCNIDMIKVYLGPRIGNFVFEVGEDVYNTFIKNYNFKNKFQINDIKLAFISISKNPNKYLLDLSKLIYSILKNIGIIDITDENICTFSEKKYFYSYRRDGITGRIGSIIWMS